MKVTYLPQRSPAGNCRERDSRIKGLSGNAVRTLLLFLMRRERKKKRKRKV
jgi:hypothetical protein